MCGWSKLRNTATSPPNVLFDRHRGTADHRPSPQSVRVCGDIWPLGQHHYTLFPNISAHFEVVLQDPLGEIPPFDLECVKALNGTVEGS